MEKMKIRIKIVDFGYLLILLFEVIFFLEYCLIWKWGYKNWLGICLSVLEGRIIRKEKESR